MRQPLPEDDLDFILSETEDVWRAMQDARILISGATGFIGSWLVECMLRANDTRDSRITVVALSRDPAEALTKAPHLRSRTDIEWHACDVRDLTHLKPGAVDAVLHAATDVGNGGRTADFMRTFDVCVEGTRQMLNLARGAQARRFLLLSSGAVYGSQPRHLARLPETYVGAPDCLSPTSAYGEGKRAAEWLTATHCADAGIDSVIGRLFALIGPNLPLNGPFAAGNFIGDALQGRPIQVAGDGTTVRSYIYIADACIWLWKMLMAAGPTCQAFNIGAQEPISIRELAQLVARQVSPAVEVRVAAQAPSLTASPSIYVPDTQSAQEQIGLTIQTPLAQAIHKTLAWNLTSTPN
jgi:nucleoside-diphosphate-sugar epimerase